MKKKHIKIALFSIAQFSISTFEINGIYGIKPYWLGQVICGLINIGLLVAYYFIARDYYCSVSSKKRYPTVINLMIFNAIEIMVFLFPIILTFAFSVNRNWMISINMYNFRSTFYYSISILSHFLCIYLGLYSVSNNVKIFASLCVFIMVSALPVINDKNC